MFQSALIRTADPAFAEASDVAFQTLREHVVRCQRTGWRPGVDAEVLASAAWSLAHGISVLRAQGSLARHCPDVSLDGVAALVDGLLNDRSMG